MLGLVIFLARHLILERLKNSIKHEYDKELETHKANLKRDYDVQVEHLKAQLQILVAEKNFRFSHTFEETATTIATVYAKLLAVLDAAEDYTILLGGPLDKEKSKQFQSFDTAAKDFYKYFHPRKIYIPKETAGQINDLMGSVFSLLRAHGMADRLADKGTPTPAGMRRLEDLEKKIDLLQNEIPKLLRSLEDKFQEILGLQMPNTQSEKATITNK